MPHDIQYWVQHLQLQPHPEGGYYRETYRSPEQVPASALPGRYHAARSFGTSIYYLLTAESFSAFHRLESDEVWHWYAGAPAEIHILHGGGKYERLCLGPHPDLDQQFQAVVPRGVWFAVGVLPDAGTADYALCGNTVAPGFDLKDLLLADVESLLEAYPQHAEVVRRFTRN